MLQAEHDKLLVHRKAVDVAVDLDVICQRLAPGRSGLRDQLLRASLSVPLNIAEGAAEYSRGEKNRFYRIARRSAAECLAILDVLRGIDPAAREELLQVSAMLTAMASRR